MRGSVPKSEQFERPPAPNGDVSERVWSHAEFALALERVKGAGPAGLRDGDLLEFCRGAHKHYKTHFWADARPFFIELWRRIGEKQIPNIRTKAEACRLIGCSLRWAELIVSGGARKKTKFGTNEVKTERETHAKDVELRTVQEYVADITAYTARKLQPLWARGEWSRCRNIYKLLEVHFDDVRKVDHVDDLNAGNAMAAAGVAS
jgi:hypothetical protein